MNKTEIIAELRRSACEDEVPFFNADIAAWYTALTWLECDRLSGLTTDELRTFYLLVACALERP